MACKLVYDIQPKTSTFLLSLVGLGRATKLNCSFADYIDLTLKLELHSIKYRKQLIDKLHMAVVLTVNACNLQISSNYQHFGWTNCCTGSRKQWEKTVGSGCGIRFSCVIQSQ